MPHELQWLLVRLRRRWRRILGSEAVFGFAAFLLAIVGLFSWSLPLHPRSLYLSCLASQVAATVGFVVVLIRLVWVAHATRKDSSIAKHIGRRIPELYSDLLSTVQLSEELGQGGSEGLKRALARESAARLADYPIHDLIAGKRLWVSVLACGLASFCIVALQFIRPGAVSAGIALLAEKPTLVPARATEPLLDDIVLDYRYPSYMRRAPQHIEASSGAIYAPRGTMVSFAARSRRPVQGATLVHADHSGRVLRRTELKVGKNRLVSGKFLLSTASPYHVEIRGHGGRVLRDVIAREVIIEPDLIPSAKIEGLSTLRRRTSNERIKFRYEASDDWGLSRISLRVGVADQPVRTMIIWRSEGNSAEQSRRGEYLWDLGSVADQLADPVHGGEVSYQLEVLDNDTVSGPNRALSKMGTFVVVSASARHERVEASHRLALNSVLDLLARRLVSGSAQGQEPGTFYKQGTRLVDIIRHLLVLMADDRATSATTRLTVSMIYDRLQRLNDEERRRFPRRDARQNSEKLMVVFKRLNVRKIEALESASVTLSDLLQESQLEAVVRLIQQLIAVHARVMNWGKGDKRDGAAKKHAAKKGLESAQMRRMWRIAENLRRQIGTIRLTGPNHYLRGNSGDIVTPLYRDLGLARRAIDAGRGSEALRLLHALKRSLFRSLGFASQSLRAFQTKRLAEREEAYQSILRQIGTLEREELEIVRQSKSFVRRYQRRVAKILNSRISAKVRKFSQRAAHLLAALQEVERAALHAYQEERLDATRRWVGWLVRSLDQGDLSDAIELSDRIAITLQITLDDLEESAIEAGSLGSKPGKARIETIRYSEDIARELSADLKGILPASRSFLKGRDRRALARLGKRQRYLRRRLRSLLKGRAKSSGHGKKGSTSGSWTADDFLIPEFLGKDGRVRLKSVDTQMREAERYFGDFRVKRGMSAAENAREELARIKRRLGKLRGEHLKNTVARRTSEKIRLPDLEDFRGPEVFRREILDAMKKPTPAGFEQAVKKYYRELIR